MPAVASLGLHALPHWPILSVGLAVLTSAYPCSRLFATGGDRVARCCNARPDSGSRLVLLSNRCAVSEVFRPAVVGDAKAGIPPAVPPEKLGLRFHDLRHTCAALLIASGTHAKVIAERLGHADIRITMNRYGHLLPAVDEAATDALDATYAAAQEFVSNVVELSPQPVEA
jgi:hypothetical protein